MSQWLGAGHASGLRRDPTTFLEGHDRSVELKEYDRRVSVECTGSGFLDKSAA